MKQYFTFISIVVMLTACTNSKKETRATAAEKLVTQYFEHFNKHDWTKMAAMYSDTAEFKDPSLGLGIIKLTRQQIVDKYSELQKMIPDVTDKVVSIYISGDNHVIIEFLSSGIAPDGSKFELPICTIFTIENGVITKDFSYFDNFGE